MMADILYFSRKSRIVAVEREIAIPEVAAARNAADPKPGWYPVLLKAFALASMKVPELRRSLLTFPTTHFYEHACTVATITAERVVDGEPTVFMFNVRQPEATPLRRIDARFKEVKSAPIEAIPEFRKFLRAYWLPRPLRRFAFWLGMNVSGRMREKHFGTFGASSMLTAGATVGVPVTSLTSLFTFGPVKPDGSVMLQLGWDHRVFDGASAARGLVETENALRNPILEELRSLARPQRLAV